MELGNTEPWTLAGKLRWRSRCRVKVGAVLVDRNGRIFAWGWNHAGNGDGMCAERHALQRANPIRVTGASIYVRGWNGRRDTVSMPCSVCGNALARAGIAYVHALDRSKMYTRQPMEPVAA